MSRNLRTRHVRALAAIVILIALVSASPASAEPPPPASTGFERASRIGFDLLILRPLNLVTTTLSLAGALVAYPVALPFGGQDHVVDYLVTDPIERTFRQPLGAL